jgi:hypothetical protein
MSIEEKGWNVLEDGTALHKIAHRENLPCCTLCAMWALDVEQDVCESSVTRYASPTSTGGRAQTYMTQRSLGVP